MKKVLLLVIVLSITFSIREAEAKRRRRAYKGPPPTHPVLLWARTVSTSTDKEQRKIAAFKLSHYSQPIFQDEAVRTLLKCVSDKEVEIKVLCTKAMGKAGNKGHTQLIRDALLDQYKKDASVRNTIVRTFVTRRDDSPLVHDTLLDALKKSQDFDEQIALLRYFESFGTGSDAFAAALVGVFQETKNPKVKSGIVTALASRAQGQDAVIDLFSKCTESSETPLVLNCLAGIQQQGKKDKRAWAAVERTVESEDEDVLMATLDVINTLPETPSEKITKRLIPIVADVDNENLDEDLQERAILALGVAGDHSEDVVQALHKVLGKASLDEGVRIASALVLGKQSDRFPEKSLDLLAKCSTSEKAATLRTACQLGRQDLDRRKKTETSTAAQGNGAEASREIASP